MIVDVNKLDELEALLARHAQGSSDLASRRVCAEALRLIRAQAEEIAQLNVELQDWIIRS